LPPISEHRLVHAWGWLDDVSVSDDNTRRDEAITVQQPDRDVVEDA
jgi:hypothetical protein